MKTQTFRLAALFTLLAILAFMFVCVSCTSVLTPERQKQLGQASVKYEQATGITPLQTVGLLGQWWRDYQAAKGANEILRTQASPVSSAKDALDVRP